MHPNGLVPMLWRRCKIETNEVKKGGPPTIVKKRPIFYPIVDIIASKKPRNFGELFYLFSLLFTFLPRE
jgi:hypothetical protein